MGDDLASWAGAVDWAKYMADDSVKRNIAKIRDRVSELDGDLDPDIANAPRVKLVVVGDGAVGKTCLLVAYQSGIFPEEYVPTVFENMTHTMDYQGQKILLLLWDTAGQEDYDRLRPLSYPGTDVVLLCFSLMNDISYEAITEKWAPEVNVYLPDVPKILVGTKVDLRDTNQADPHADGKSVITTEMGKQLAKDVGCAAYVEVSARTGKGLAGLYDKAVEIVLSSRNDASKKPAKKDSKPAPKRK